MTTVFGTHLFPFLSYRQKLTFVMTVTSVLLLLLVSAGFFAYEWKSYRSELKRDASSLAEIVGEGAGAALLFGDKAAARDVLQALSTDDHVLSAVIYDARGSVFSVYERSLGEATAAIPRVEATGNRYQDSQLMTFSEVQLDGEQVGTVFVRMSTAGLEQRLQSLALLGGGVLLLAILMAAILSNLVQRILSQPILDLASAARRISNDKDYSVRVEEGKADELGTLSRAFNEMLTQIELRDQSVEAARAELEVRLQELEEQIRQTKEAQDALAKSEEQLRQAQKMEAIGILAGGVAHDFNNILTAILGYGQLLVRRMDADSPHRDTVKEIINAGNRAAGLTSQLLAFSRRQILEPRVLNLNEVVRNMEKMLRRLIGEDVDFLTVLEPELGRVKVDPGQIEQILLNLAVNSRDAMPDGGTLIFETKNAELDSYYADTHAEVTPGQYVMISVSDNGCGMDEEMRDHIFEPFFTSKEKGKGTGLGLSTVFGIIKQSGGHVTVYSEPGQGTTFKIYLPLAEAEQRPRDEAQDVAPPADCNERLLLVEDQEQVREVVGQMLESYGYEVLRAACGEEAIQVCTDHPEPIDLLLTDLVMPGMSGRELSEHLALLRPDTKCLFMSGYTDDAVVRNKVLESGIPFIHKPFTADALQRAIRKVLDKRAAA